MVHTFAMITNSTSEGSNTKEFYDNHLYTYTSEIFKSHHLFGKGVTSNRMLIEHVRCELWTCPYYKAMIPETIRKPVAEIKTSTNLINFPRFKTERNSIVDICFSKQIGFLIITTRAWVIFPMKLKWWCSMTNCFCIRIDMNVKLEILKVIVVAL